jgi:hypothetical protein
MFLSQNQCVFYQIHRIENFEIEKSKGILENIKQGPKEKTTKYFY